MFLLIFLMFMCSSMQLFPAGCPPLVPGENLWQLTASIYCLASKIDSEITGSVESTIIGNICSCVSTAVQTLSILDVIIKSDIDSVSTKVDSVGTQVSQLRSDLDACCSTVSSKIDSVGSQVSQVKSDLDSCCGTLSVLDTIIKSDVDSVSTKADSIGSQIMQLDSDLDACCAAVSSKIDSVGSQVSQVKSDLDSCCGTLSVLDVIIKSDVDSVSTKADSIGSQITQLDSDLDACCASLSILDVIIKSDIDSVSTKTDSIGSQITQLDSDLDACCAAVSSKIDSVGSQVSQLQSDLDSCCGTLSVLDTIIKSDVDNVSSTLDVLVNCTLGTQITQAMMPFTISAPGHYYLCSSVSSTGANAVTINASDVYFNLNGFTISSPDSVAINSSGFSNITIENGSINTTLAHGINIGTTTNLTLRNLTMIAQGLSACNLGTITNLVIEDCYMTGNGTGTHGVEIGGIIGGRLENVFVYNTLDEGFMITSTDPDFTLTCIKCTADVTLYGFSLGSTGGVVLRECIASGSNRGFQIMGEHVLEDCVAMDNVGAGFWIESATNPILRNCVAESTTGGSGFQARTATSLLCEGCIAKDSSSHGFFLDPALGSNTDCIFDHCLSSNNTGNGFFMSGLAENTRIMYSTATGNGGSGIIDAAGVVNTFVVDCRSQHAATATNPAYNLNTNPDSLVGAGDTVIIIS